MNITSINITQIHVGNFSTRGRILHIIEKNALKIADGTITLDRLHVMDISIITKLILKMYFKNRNLTHLTVKMEFLILIKKNFFF